MLSLRVNFAWTLLGNVIYSASQWGLLILMAKFGSVQMVGQFTLGLAVTAPIFMFTNLQLRAIQATDMRNQYNFGQFISLRIIGITCAIIILAIIMLTGGYQKETNLIILLVAFMKGAEALSDSGYGLLQKYEQMDKIAKSMILRGILSLIAAALVLYISPNIVQMTFVIFCVWSIVLLIYDLPNSRRYAPIKLTFFPKCLFSLVRLGFPLAIVMLLISLNANIPRYFIENFWGLEELGYYAAISYVMVAGTTVVNALGQSVSPRLARYYTFHSSHKFAQLIRLLLLIGIAIGLLGICLVALVGENLLAFFYNSDYAKYNEIFLLLMVATAISFLSSFIGYAMTAARIIQIQAPINVVITILHLVLCQLLIPTYGIMGAAYALVFNNLLQLLLVGVAFGKKSNISLLNKCEQDWSAPYAK